MSRGILLLAAGSSSRMGRPKQLLRIGDKFLINHIIEVISQLKNTKIVVVLGANYSEIKTHISLPNHCTCVFNEDWNTGMASSIKKGVSILSTSDNILICTVDQPDLSSQHLELMYNVFVKEEAGIVASSYGGTLGIPALFDNIYFEDLINLEGDKGAKCIFEKYRKKLKAVPFFNGEYDLDTEEDYNNWKKNNHY